MFLCNELVHLLMFFLKWLNHPIINHFNLRQLRNEYIILKINTMIFYVLFIEFEEL